jgi:heat-inducible transcriptional repressor
MLNNRQQDILRILVEEFIQTAEPVGSKSASLESLGFSSATIRNDMAILETLGYLEKTHTSSGRIPSDKGYRYYVDEILKINQPKDSNFPKVDELLGNYLLGNDEVLKKALETISEMTKYTSMILTPSDARSLVKKIELVKIAANEALIMIVTDSGHVEKRKLFMDGMEIEELHKVVRILNDLLINTPVGDIANRLAYELSQSELKEYLQYHQTLIEAFVRAFSKFNEQQFFMSGQYNLLYEPEFNDINKMRRYIEAIENKEIFRLIDTKSKGVTVKIGLENTVQFLENCTVISVPYQIPTGEQGAIAVIGPRRMNYRRVIPLLEYLAMNMSDFEH